MRKTRLRPHLKPGPRRGSSQHFYRRTCWIWKKENAGHRQSKGMNRKEGRWREECQELVRLGKGCFTALCTEMDASVLTFNHLNWKLTRRLPQYCGTLPLIWFFLRLLVFELYEPERTGQTDRQTDRRMDGHGPYDRTTT